MKNLKIYHWAWLSAHPERTPEWLSERVQEGFQIHHLDLNHNNDAPSNLILIEGIDHLRLHGLKVVPFTRQRAQKLVTLRNAKVPKWRRKQIARKAARARWKKAKQAAAQITPQGAEHDAR